MFWKHRGDDNLIDNEIVNFISGLAINSYAENLDIFESEEDEQIIRKLLEKKKEKNITEEAVRRERIERRIKLLFNNPNEIIPEDFPTKKSLTSLRNCFDTYSDKKYKNDELKPENLILWDFLEAKKVKINSDTEIDNSLFIQFVKSDEATYKQRVLFYAQTLFLLDATYFEDNAFTDWMRVVRNIVQNTEIDNTTIIAAITLIKEISAGCSNIYKYLSEKDKLTSGHAREQLKEEIAKAKIIISEPNTKSVIHKTEDTNFCKGKIIFPLYCIDYEIGNDNLSQFDINKLEKVLSVINDNFEVLQARLSDNFKRAFLTIKGNDYYEVWGTKSYSFNSKKRWLLGTVDDLKKYFSENSDWKRDYLKDLFLKLIDKSLDDIILEFTCPKDMPNWKEKLIKKTNLFDGATFILISNSDSFCKLALQQKPSREDQVKKIE